MYNKPFKYIFVRVHVIQTTFLVFYFSSDKRKYLFIKLFLFFFGDFEI